MGRAHLDDARGTDTTSAGLPPVIEPVSDQLDDTVGRYRRVSDGKWVDFSILGKQDQRQVVLRGVPRRIDDRLDDANPPGRRAARARSDDDLAGSKRERLDTMRRGEHHARRDHRAGAHHGLRLATAQWCRDQRNDCVVTPIFRAPHDRARALRRLRRAAGERHGAQRELGEGFRSERVDARYHGGPQLDGYQTQL